VVTCIGVVVSEREQFIYPIVKDTLPDWVVLRWWDGVSGLSGMAWRCLGNASGPGLTVDQPISPGECATPLDVKCGNGGEAASIVPPTIYLPAGPGAHIPNGIPSHIVRARPSREADGTPTWRSGAGMFVAAVSEDPGRAGI
jgi:hypothetical protein